MSDVIETFHRACLIFCVCATALIAICWAMAIILRQRRAFWSTSEALVYGIFALFACLYGGTKPSTTPVAWDEYFADKSYLIDTNDLRRISFAWTSPEWMPAAAKAVLHAFRRAATVPELPEEVIANAPMSAGAMTAVMPYEATNYAFFVECDWTPAPAIVTNGVYHVRAVENAEKVVPIGVNIKLPKREESPQ